MTIARREIIDYGASGTYHCISRCVRRAFLCGVDKWTGKSYEYRRDWVRDRLKAMSEAFAVDILAFAVMSNHFHVVLRNDVDREQGWSDEDVVRRWLTVYPKRHVLEDGTYVYETRPEDVVSVLSEEGRVAVLRDRLSDISDLSFINGNRKNVFHAAALIRCCVEDSNIKFKEVVSCCPLAVKV